MMASLVDPLADETDDEAVEEHALVVQQAMELITATDSLTFAREMIARKQLTPFQAKALMRGRWKGLVLGNYIVLEKLGQGGMGQVFKAQHKRMGRIVCLKVLDSKGRKSPELLDRFRQEARTVAALNHSHIVVAHDADEEDGIPFLVMEFVQGSDLAKYVSQHGPLAVERVPASCQGPRVFARRRGGPSRCQAP